MAKRRGFPLAAAASGLLLLGGCVSATDYSAGSEALKGSPALQREMIGRCIKDNRSTPEQKDLMTKMMNLAPGSDVVRVACERLTTGFASGRISREDVQAMNWGHVTPQVVRVLQAR